MTSKQPSGICHETIYGLDQLSVLPFINGSLSQIMDKLVDKFGDEIPKQCSKDIETIQHTLSIVQKEGTRMLARVSRTPTALTAYGTLRQGQPLEWTTVDLPKAYRNRPDAFRVKSFLDEHRDLQKVLTKRGRETWKHDNETKPVTPPEKKQRKSKRIVTPDKAEQIMSLTTSDTRWTKRMLLDSMTGLIGTGNIQSFVNSILACGDYLKIGGEKYDTAASIYKLYNKEGFTGLPPEGCEKWPREALCRALSDISKEADNTVTMNAFKLAVIAKGKSDYNTIAGITKMYNKWKNGDKTEVPAGVGRPPAANVNELRDGLDELVEQGGLGDTNVITSQHVAQVIEKKRKQQAEADGLDPETVDVTVCDKTSQMYLVAVGMAASKDDKVQRKLSQKRLHEKTITRWIAEHSTMAAMSNTCTCIATHAIEGKRPPELGGPIDYDNLSDDVKETFEMAKEALGSDDVYFVHPNCVLSIDDSRVFAFEGTVDKNGAWSWVLINESGDSRNSGTDSHFKVTDNAGKKGGISVKITFAFTAAGLMAPIYVAVTGLTEKELDPVLCPSGFLPYKIPNLCKGGNDVYSGGGFGWVVFQRADKKSGGNDNKNSVASTKFDHYNKFVLLPFIRKIRQQLGWTPGNPIPEWLKVCCWCDGDIPQLQAMLIEANDKLDEMEKIVRNKHPAAGTGRYQPADLSPFFKILHFVSDRTTAKNSQACALKNTLVELINGPLRAKGLNLDGKHGKKNGLIDLLCCIPQMLEENATMDNLSKGFILGGMISKDDRQNPSWNALMSCNRNWGSAKKERGVPKEVKDNCRKQFQPLMKIQLDKGQVTAEDMLAAGLPRDTYPDGTEVDKNKPSGSHAEHLQYAKNMNNQWQRRMRQEGYSRKAEEKYKDALDEFNSIGELLSRNSNIEEELRRTVTSGLLADVTLESFMKPTVEQLQDFIHCRKFNGKIFHKTKLYGSDKKLNKRLRPKQTVDEMRVECSFDRPCYVWLAWMLRTEELVLKRRQQPLLQNLNPQSSLSFASPLDTTVLKNASDYLCNSRWREAAELNLKGVTICDVDDRMTANADQLVPLMMQRLNRLISARVDEKCSSHIALKFVRENLPSVAAQMCLVGHIVRGVELSSCDDRLLVLPSRNTFLKFDANLGKLEGCYLCYDREKDKWIRDGFASGLGTCFESRIKKHQQNSRSINEMRTSRFYAYYPSKDAPETYGSVRNAYFEDLDFYCAMAFNPNSVEQICSVDGEDSLFVWSKEFIGFLSNKAKSNDVPLERMQITAVAYLWEMCYDLMLAKSDNISHSPGFEGLGLCVKK